MAATTCTGFQIFSLEVESPEKVKNVEEGQDFVLCPVLTGP